MIGNDPKNERFWKFIVLYYKKKNIDNGGERPTNSLQTKCSLIKT
jgi:hypothetical protein